MKIASTFFLGLGALSALAASFTGPVETGFDAKYASADSYIAGGAFEVTVSVDADGTGTDVPSWLLNSTAFKVDGKALGKRAKGTLTLEAGTNLTSTFDLGPALAGAEVTSGFSLSFADGEAKEIGVFRPAPAGLDFIDPAKIADADLANYRVLMTTNQGDMLMEMYPHLAPNHVRNFLDLSYTGFYNNVSFHRVIPGFMIQGGDPQGTGGGNGPRMLNAEFSTEKHVRGILSMARTNDPNSASCQFFVMHATAAHLDGAYSVFGKLVTGFDALDRIVSSAPRGSERPSEPQTILSATVLYVPDGK